MALIHIAKSSLTRWGGALLSAAAVACLYALTLMSTISGCAHEYCADVGEFQVALPLWGTVHHTGYPLYMLLGSPFVTVLNILGIPPALGASIAGILLGDGIVLERWEIRPLSQEGLHIILYWAAVYTPTADYSSSIHVSDQEIISRPEDIIAQSDYYAPVYGWYPTSRWVPNEIIREDHLIQIPLGRSPRSIHIGMYNRDSTGRFHELGPRVILQQEDGQWVTKLPSEP